MKTIRNNVFETNSSSTHTIVIPRNQKQKERNNPQVLVATLGEYGWEYETYYDLLSYIYTAICCVYKEDYKKYTDKIDELASKYNMIIKWEEPEFHHYVIEPINKYQKPRIGCYLENGSIDHDYELENFLKDLFADESLLLDAILGGYVNTGNDNEDYSRGWEDGNETNEDCYYYYKEN